MKPRRTVLDSELISMSDRLDTGGRDMAVLPLEDLGLFRSLGHMPEGAEPASPMVSVKLIVVPGSAGQVGEWVMDRGGSIVSRGPEVLLCDLEVDALRDLDDCRGVKRAEAARLFLPRLTDARGEATGLDDALENHGLSGHGVVLGVIDTGVDWRHQDFRDAKGDTRLEMFIHAHRIPHSSVSVYDEYDADNLNQAIGGNFTVPDGDPNGHGTHCASIAAGNGLASPDQRFRGVAPEASLVGVRSDPLLDDHIIQGIRRIFEIAGDRPAVVSLSLGGHLGPHDGTTALENVIARETGRGRIVVVAAGNEGSDGIHWQGELSVGSDLEIPVRIGDSGVQYVDLWVPRGDEVDIEIETPDGSRFVPDGTDVATIFGTFRADFRDDPLNRDQNLTLLVQNSLVNFVWRIRLTPQRVTQGVVHAWAGTGNPSTSAHLFQGIVDDRFTIGIPATEERAIAVGSFVSRSTVDDTSAPPAGSALTVGQLSPFSSRGPTRIGRQKPDIAAPGQYITAALAANSKMATSPSYTPRHHQAGPYITIQGTSMATPFVAGVVALLLEREPDLTPEEIQQRLRVTAARDELTGRVWESGLGFGRLDALALLNYEEGTGNS